MSRYEELMKKSQMIRMFEPELDAGLFRFDRDGNIKAFQRLTHDMPWLQTKEKLRELTGNACNRYQLTAKRLGFVHSVCLDCYKVVVKINTVKQLFDYYEYMMTVGRPGKCGIETRDFVPRLYGGYWYNRGVEEGRECHAVIERDVHKHISKDIRVILKRGCTEYEAKFGDSLKWAKLPNQEEWEQKLSEKLVEDCKVPKEDPEDLTAYIKTLWIDFAANAMPPDMTYLELTGGHVLHKEVPYRTYHRESNIKAVGK